MSLVMSAARFESEAAETLVPFGVVRDEGESEGGREAGLRKDLRALDRYSARVRFARNETIFNEGDNAGHAYKVISGTVRMCKHTKDGRRQIADFLVPGNLFGIVDRGEYGFSAEAVSDVILISYPRNQLDRLWATNPGMVDRLFAMLTEQFMTMQRHMVVLGCQNAKERVASFLLRLADRSRIVPGERLDLPMGRQDIASHLGLTIETVCRAIAELKREGAVIVPNLNQLILSNLAMLRGLANGEHRC